MKESPSLPRNALYRGHSPCILIWELPLEVFPLPSKVRPFPAPLHHITHPSCPLMNHHTVLSPQTPGQEHRALNPVPRLPHPPPSSRLLPSHCSTHPGPASHPYLTLPGQSCHFHQHLKAGTLQILASILTFVLRVRIVQQRSRKLL